MPRRPFSLRFVLGSVTLALTALALLASAALVLMTSYLHRATLDLGGAIESVRATRAIRADLIAHSRTREPGARRSLEAVIRKDLEEVAKHVSSADEQQAMAAARSLVELYLQANSPAHLERAVSAADRLVNINMAQARETQRQAGRLDRAADAIGLGCSFLLIVLSGTLLWWLRARLIRPVLSLAKSMGEYAGGNERARAAVAGPREIRKMAIEFNEMASSLAARRDRQMAFLAAVAHDVRTPLAVLRTSVAVMTPDRPLPDEPLLRQTIARIERQVKRLERLMQDLIETAKIESGRLELHLGLHDARALVGTVADLFEESAPRHQLLTVVPDGEVLLQCDPFRLEQVLNNLVSNAIKYSPEGGPVEIALRTEPGWGVIPVSDRGVGISEDDRNQLFEPFRRLGQSQESIPGVGMGLFVVRRIVEAHQGRVEVESQPGRGSTFRVRLPLAQSSRAEGRGDRRRIRQSGRAGDRTSRQSASAGRGPRA